MLSSDIGLDKARYQYPVVVIPGMNHASFLGGDPPAAVKMMDLRSEISPGRAIDMISDVTAAFITLTRQGVDTATDARRLLDNYIDNISGPMLNPIINMFTEEGAPFISSYRNSTPWAMEA